LGSCQLSLSIAYLASYPLIFAYCSFRRC
jgi:hypothetical protein